MTKRPDRAAAAGSEDLCLGMSPAGGGWIRWLDYCCSRSGPEEDAYRYIMHVTAERLMASGAVVVIAGYALRLLGVALFGVSSSGTVALLVVNMFVLAGMVTFVIACSTWLLKVGLRPPADRNSTAGVS